MGWQGSRRGLCLISELEGGMIRAKEDTVSLTLAPSVCGSLWIDQGH